MTDKPTGHRHLKLKLQQLIENLTKEYSVEKVTTNIIVFKKGCPEIQMFVVVVGGGRFLDKWIGNCADNHLFRLCLQNTSYFSSRPYSSTVTGPLRPNIVHVNADEVLTVNAAVVEGLYRTRILDGIANELYDPERVLFCFRFLYLNRAIV